MSGEGVRELTNPKLAGEGFLSRRPSHVFADRWPPSVASWVSDGTGRRSTSCVIVKDSPTTVSTRTGGLLMMLYTTVLYVKPMSTMLGSQKRMVIEILLGQQIQKIYIDVFFSTTVRY